MDSDLDVAKLHLQLKKYIAKFLLEEIREQLPPYASVDVHVNIDALPVRADFALNLTMDGLSGIALSELSSKDKDGK